MPEFIEFPNTFIWGTAISAHQTEGHNTNSDWWHWEKDSKAKNKTFPLEESNEACDFYNRFSEDLDLCKQLNNDAIRLSIEWARIEPTKGNFDQKAIDYYRKILQSAKNKGLLTFVTLHHFTLPQWAAVEGGWHSVQISNLFAKYAEKVAQELNDEIDFYITINEPQVYTLLGYFGVYDYKQKALAMWPPATRNPILGLFAMINFVLAHKKAYKSIKNTRSNAIVGIVKNITWWETDPYNTKLHDLFFTRVLNFTGKGMFLKPLVRHLDFLGVNYYFTNRIVNLKRSNPNDYVSDLGWWINPYGLQRILEYLKSYKIPIYITENGLADANDTYRKTFIKEHLIAIHNAISKKIDVRGYFHWSLIDNYEWHQGYWPKFGLVEIDRKNNLQRKPRASYYYYAKICKEHKLDIEENV